MSVVVPFPTTERDELQPACADRNPDLWFDERQYERGQRICRECPARASCLAEALSSGERLGVWGGLTPAQRDRLPDARIIPLHPRAS